MKQGIHFLTVVLVGFVAMRDPFFLPEFVQSVVMQKKVALVGIAHAEQGSFAIVIIDGVRHCVTKGQKAGEYLVRSLNEQSIELVAYGDVLKLSVV